MFESILSSHLLRLITLEELMVYGLMLISIEVEHVIVKPSIMLDYPRQKISSLLTLKFGHLLINKNIPNLIFLLTKKTKHTFSFSYSYEDSLFVHVYIFLEQVFILSSPGCMNRKRNDDEEQEEEEEVQPNCNK